MGDCGLDRCPTPNAVRTLGACDMPLLDATGGSSLGSAKLVGVRDVVSATNRMEAPLRGLVFGEQYMADMFWEIPSSEVLNAVQWAVAQGKKTVAWYGSVVLDLTRPDLHHVSESQTGG